MTDENEFKPDWASPPGATIVDIITEKGLKPLDVARHLGLSVETFALLLAGETQIDDWLAIKLELVLGPPAAFWKQREKQFRERVKEADIVARGGVILELLRHHARLAETEGSKRPGSLYRRELGEQREIVVYPMVMGRARLCLSEDDFIVDAYCYDDPNQAIDAAIFWTGEGDPLDGWTKNPITGRRRPGGDPTKETRDGDDGAPREGP